MYSTLTCIKCVYNRCEICLLVLCFILSLPYDEFVVVGPSDVTRGTL